MARARCWLVRGTLGFWLALLASCSSEDTAGGSSTGGTTSVGGTTGVGGTGGVGAVGGAVGGAGQGGQGATAGTGGQGATGATAGTGGAAGGAGGAGATGGMGAMGGAGGGAGAGGAGGAAGTGGAGGSDGFVSGVSIAVHPNVTTVLEVTWQQIMAADTTWLEFTFEAGNVMTSRPKPATLGAHKDVVLGVPGATLVTVRIVNSLGGVETKTSDYQGTTDALPSGFPPPEVIAYDAALASTDRWLFGSVEDSLGGASGNTNYYRFTFWIYIMDRKGRIVWYYADPASNATSSFQRLARDGEYIWIEKRAYHGEGTAQSVLKMTLDWSYFEDIPVAIADCIDVTDDGSFLYDLDGVLKEQTKDGQTRDIWTCDAGGAGCYSNTVNWNPLADTVLLSFPYDNMVVEIDRQSGSLVGRYGTGDGAYTFSPDTWEFGFQHFANITAEGTLMVSSHMPGAGNDPVAGEHGFLEFTIDRANTQLVEKWFYNEGPEWADMKGMAVRMPNGNTLVNYGTGGVIREVTPDKQTAFHVKFDVPDGDDFFNKMVGNNFFIDDLYAMNGGPN